MNITEFTLPYIVLGGFVIGILLLLCVSVAFLRIPPVPTRRKEEEIIFELAQLQPGETFYDLGAGDGRLVQVAFKKYRAHACGWEINIPVWFVAWLQSGGKVRLGSLWTAPVHKADVVVTFLMPSVMGRVEREIWPKLKPGARLISNAFPLPGVTPTASKEGVYLYRRS